MMDVLVKVRNSSGFALPEYQTVGSAGIDLKACLPASVKLAPMERKLIPTGLFVEIPVGWEMQIRPRSGLALKSGITVLNSPGTIDSDYRGEIGVILINLSTEPFEINSGDRIAQAVLAEYGKISWSETQNLTETDRGSGGFGHTGKV